MKSGQLVCAAYHCKNVSVKIVYQNKNSDIIDGLHQSMHTIFGIKCLFYINRTNYVSLVEQALQ